MMTRHMTLPPFLQKLKTISETVPGDIADWSEDGLSYIVKNSDKFEEVLKQHFKGSLQTFIRQLHFYGFRKLDAQNGGWSFAHKNFQKDKPELIAEIRRKTRSDTNSNTAATQVEVLELRSQVAKLQDVVEDLRTQLDSVLNVLDSAGVVDVVKKSDGKVSGVRVPISVSAPLVQQQTQSEQGRKRFRSMDHSALEPTEDDDMNMKDSDSESQQDVVVKLEDGEATAENASADGEEECLARDLQLKEEEEGPNFEQFSYEQHQDNILEPLPIDMEGIEDIFDIGDTSNLFDSELAEELEVDAGKLRSSETSGESAATTAKVVADATQLDPVSVQKVLAFLKKAIKADTSSAEIKAVLPDLVSFPQIQNAVLNYKNALPTQEVGAN